MKRNERSVWSGIALGFTSLLLLASVGLAADVGGAAAPAGPSAALAKEPVVPSVHTVTRAPAKRVFQLDAVFVAVEMAPVKLDPKVWADLTVLDAVPHGARVKKGDVLVRLDLDKLKEQIDDLELDRPGAALALELATAELANLELATPLKLETAQRTHRVASEDLAYFENTGRAAKEKAARFVVKSADQRLQGAQEELKQLQKMYRADDLVEETEEIILKRQKFAVEAAQFGLDAAQQDADWSLNKVIPREADVFKTAKRDQDLMLAWSQQTLPETLAKKRFDVEKLKRDQKKAEKKLAELKKDFEMLAVRSPSDGYVYYGACENGKWTTGATFAKKLLPGAKLTASEIFMTIVNPERLELKAIVPEADFAQYKPGLDGKASPVSAPDLKLPVKLEEVGAVPLLTGGFDARLSVQLGADARVMPGMNGKVTFGESQPGALTIPREAVFSEGGASLVLVVKPDNTNEKRIVKTGADDGKMVEVLQGLAEGEKVWLSKPQ